MPHVDPDRRRRGHDEKAVVLDSNPARPKLDVSAEARQPNPASPLSSGRRTPRSKVNTRRTTAGGHVYDAKAVARSRSGDGRSGSKQAIPRVRAKREPDFLAQVRHPDYIFDQFDVSQTGCKQDQLRRLACSMGAGVFVRRGTGRGKGGGAAARTM